MQPEPSDYQEDDGVDLRPILNSLIRRWRMVRDVTIAAVVVALVLTAFSPRTYQATAVVALLRSASQVQLQNQIKTVSPDTLNGQAATANPTEVRSTLAALVSNPRIADQVIHDLGNRLPPGLRNPNVLVGVIQGTPGKDSDTVNITAHVDDPELATELANAWATDFESFANRTYSETPAPDSSFQSELASAKSDYDKANVALVQFTAQDREDQLQREIDDRKQLIDSLQKGRQAAIAAILAKRSQAEADYVGKYVTAALDLAGQPMTQQAQAQVDRLGTLYAARARNDWLLEGATTLRAELGRPGASAANTALALEILKAELVANPNPASIVSTSNPSTTVSTTTNPTANSTPVAGTLAPSTTVSTTTNGGTTTSTTQPVGLPGNLQVTLSPAGSSGESLKAQTDDLDALISALQSRQQDLDGQIAQQRQVMEAGGGITPVSAAQAAGNAGPLMAQAQQLATNLAQLDGVDQAVNSLDGSDDVTKTMDRLSTEISGLQAQLTQASATKDELTQQRDLAYKTYTSLQAKAQEMTVAAQLPSSEVVFAVPATFPMQSVEAGRRAITVGIAIALGVIVGAFLALALDYLAPAAPTLAVPWTAPIWWVRAALAGRRGAKRDSPRPA